MKSTSLLAVAWSLAVAGPAPVRAEEAPAETRFHDYLGMRLAFTPLEQGHRRYTMTPDQLADIISAFERQVVPMQAAIDGLNLPARDKAIPGEAMALLRRMVREMGDKIFFYSPPELFGRQDLTGDKNATYSRFTFTDGNKFVRVEVGVPDPNPRWSAPMVGVRVFRTGGTRDKVEQEQRIALGRKSEVALKEWDRSPRIKSTGAPGEPFHLVETSQTRDGVTRRSEYKMMDHPDMFFVRRSGTGKPGFALRSQRPGAAPREVAITDRETRDQLYVMAHSKAFRVRMPKSHPHYSPGFVEVQDIDRYWLGQAGVQAVATRSGAVYLRRTAAFDRSALHRLGVTWVDRSRDGRRPHLRALHHRSKR